MRRRAARTHFPPFLLLLSVFSVFSVVESAPAQEAEAIIENIWVGLAEGLDDGVYKIGTWTPVQVDIQAGPEGFRGLMRVIVPDDHGTPTAVVEAVDITAGTTAPVTTYVRPGGQSAEFHVELYREGRRRPVTERGTAVGEVDFLNPGQLLIATLGDPQGLDLLPALGEFKIENSMQESSIRVSRMRVPGGIPSKWYGYDGVDVVVLDTNDPDVLPALDQFRNLALKEWVRNGGHLVVTVGQRWQVVNDSFLAAMLPAVPNGQTPTRDLGMVEAFAGSNKPITTPEGPESSITSLALLPERSAKPLDQTGRDPVLARGAYGLGRVTVIGLDVDRSPFGDWPDRGRFWVRALDLTPPAATAGPSNAFAVAQVNDLSSYLHNSLQQFEGVRLIPFGWVAFFVFLYILLIGPGDYFFLKKVVKRMELTWVTFPAIVLTVSLAAYAAAYAVKGTDLRINRVDVVDVDQGFGAADGTYFARGYSFASLFSPQNRDYTLAAVPLDLAGPAPSPAEGVAAEAPPEAAGVQTITSWYGIAEDRFNSMTSRGSGRMGLGSGYAYGPLNGQAAGDPQEMRDVRVQIWSTESLASQWFDAAGPLVTAELKRRGGDRLEGTITNRLDRPMRNLLVAFGRQAYVAERELAPGETVRIDDLKNQNLPAYLERIEAAIPRMDAYNLQNARVDTARADLVRALMFNHLGRTKGLKPSLVLRRMDLSGLLELDRPMVVAEIDGPAALLALGRAPSKAPKVAQTTVVRAVLPAIPE